MVAGSAEGGFFCSVATWQMSRKANLLSQPLNLGFNFVLVATAPRRAAEAARKFSRDKMGVDSFFEETKFSLRDKEVLLRKTKLFLFRALKAAPETAGRSHRFWGLRPQNPHRSSDTREVWGLPR